jgi:hypothetical protein
MTIFRWLRRFGYRVDFPVTISRMPHHRSAPRRGQWPDDPRFQQLIESAEETKDVSATPSAQWKNTFDPLTLPSRQWIVPITQVPRFQRDLI